MKANTLWRLSALENDRKRLAYTIGIGRRTEDRSTSPFGTTIYHMRRGGVFGLTSTHSSGEGSSKEATSSCRQVGLRYNQSTAYLPLNQTHRSLVRPPDWGDYP